MLTLDKEILQDGKNKIYFVLNLKGYLKVDLDV